MTNKSNFLLLLQRIFILMLLFTISRFLFLIINFSYFHEAPKIDLVLSFFFGLRFDITAIVLCNLLFIFLHFFSFSFFYSKWYQRFTAFIFYLINIPLLLLNCIDLVLFRFAGKRATADVFKIMSFGEDFTNAVPKMILDFWYLVLLVPPAAVYFFMQAWKRNEKVQHFMDRLLLKLPIFGTLVDKSVIARWTRTLSTMFAAGVPLVESLDSVAGASGNRVYEEATKRIQLDVAQGTSLSAAMTTQRRFPVMVLQMTAIGEESGSLDHMLGKAADFYEAEVDDMVAGISSLMEPIIIVVLGVVIGGIVISMYLPIFKLGQVV